MVTTRWWAEISGAMAVYENGPSAPPPPELATSVVVFKRLARKYHPDLAPWASEIMKDLNRLCA